MAGQVTCNLTINFDSNITSVSLRDSGNSTVTYTSSGQQKEVILDSYALIPVTAVLANGYKLNSVTAESGSVTIEDITNNIFKISCGVATTNATITITSVQEQEKAISLSNLKKFKELCDQTYAKTGEGSGLTVININTGTSSGTLNSDDFAKVQANPQNVVFYDGDYYYYPDMGDEYSWIYSNKAFGIGPSSSLSNVQVNQITLEKSGAGAWSKQLTTLNVPSGGGTQLYRHTLLLHDGSASEDRTFYAISTRSEQYTVTDQIYTDFNNGSLLRMNLSNSGLVVDMTKDATTMYYCNVTGIQTVFTNGINGDTVTPL